MKKNLLLLLLFNFFYIFSNEFNSIIFSNVFEYHWIPRSSKLYIHSSDDREEVYDLENSKIVKLSNANRYKYYSPDASRCFRLKDLPANNYWETTKMVWYGLAGMKYVDNNDLTTISLYNTDLKTTITSFWADKQHIAWADDSSRFIFGHKKFGLMSNFVYKIASRDGNILKNIGSFTPARVKLIKWSPDGSQFAIGFSDGTHDLKLKIYEYETLNVIQSFSNVAYFEWSSDNSQCIVHFRNDRKYKAILYDTKTFKKIFAFHSVENIKTSFSSDGSQIFIGYYGDSLRAKNLMYQAELRDSKTLNLNKRWLDPIKLSWAPDNSKYLVVLSPLWARAPDGSNYLVLVSPDKFPNVEVYDAYTNRLLKSFSAKKAFENEGQFENISIQWSGDSSKVALLYDQELEVFDLEQIEIKAGKSKKNIKSFLK